MTRYDRRLMLAILSTAVCTASTTAAWWHWHAPQPSRATTAASAPAPSLDPTPLAIRLVELEIRIATLEASAAKPLESCDEVSCVLDNYDPGCCAQYQRHLPLQLDGLMIAQTLATVTRPIVSCGPHTGITGRVVLRVTVEPGGNVSSLHVVESPSDELGKCVGHEVERASFPRTQVGGVFRVPFTF